MHTGFFQKYFLVLIDNKVFRIGISMNSTVGHHSFPAGPPLGIDHGDSQPPVRPTPRPNVQPPPSGTHLVFAQNGRIEHIPLEGYDMKPDQAKTVLHLPVSLLCCVATCCCFRSILLGRLAAFTMGCFIGLGFPKGFSKMFDMWFESVCYSVKWVNCCVLEIECALIVMACLFMNVWLEERLCVCAV